MATAPTTTVSTSSSKALIRLAAELPANIAIMPAQKQLRRPGHEALGPKLATVGTGAPSREAAERAALIVVWENKVSGVD